eukprot:NODE_3959_length_619_cov_78.782456_g2848_i0.p1 GENE.NODE_3959_length_619_cov_78.782456_g2848_i0~~NODE_3959_length_619_cov_78.782456_g2848_i0.p1  ORF type:complete len:136 (+),score=5.68 NODE_3959_length_619_cov_78.782456_g2848_i0:151-558(+)
MYMFVAPGRSATRSRISTRLEQGCVFNLFLQRGRHMCACVYNYFHGTSLIPRLFFFFLSCFLFSQTGLLFLLVCVSVSDFSIRGVHSATTIYVSFDGCASLFLQRAMTQPRGVFDTVAALFVGAQSSLRGGQFYT